MEHLRRIVICGVGLIGGSFALAQKSAASARRQKLQIVGLGRTRSALEEARRLGLIDQIAQHWSEALPGADLVLLAMPVGQTAAVLRAMAPHLAPGTLLTDAGSTKGDVIAAARAALGEKIARFVPGHPIAGAEKSGPAAASSELFRDKRVILTPLPENPPAAVQKIAAAWQDCGARIETLSAEEHDQIFAAVSHLPHLLAYALVYELGQRSNAERLFAFAGSGFRDFTRIAGSHPEMWCDIALGNRMALLAELDAYINELIHLRTSLAATDGNALQHLFATARDLRNRWQESTG